MLNITVHQKNANQTPDRIALPPTRMAIITETDNKCWWEMEKLEPFGTAGGNVKWGSRFGKQSDSSLNIQLPYVPAILLPGRETETYNHAKLGHDS